MTDRPPPPDRIGDILRPCRAALAACALFSAFVNLLMLTGPLFMQQVYDRVLPARSPETLAALFLLVLFLFALLALADVARTRILARCADHLQIQLDLRVFPALLGPPAGGPPPAPPTLLRDIDALRRALSAPVTLAAMDLPWLPVFLGALCLLHPLFGLLALAGGAGLAAITWAAHRRIRALTRTAAAASRAADATAAQFLAQPEATAAFALGPAAARRWQAHRQAAARSEARLTDTAGLASSISRAARLLLQSAMLGLAAWLFLQGQVSAGAMSAASILMGRTLVPVETLIAGWALAERALAARARLSAFLRSNNPVPTPTALPAPAPRLSATGLTVTAPGGGKPLLRDISLSVEPGQILGIVGPSGAGKSALVRALAGLWPPVRGEVRLDGAHLGQYAPATRAAALGYLPQRPGLFDGTIAENIARLDPAPNAAAVVAAARAAGAHDLIVGLPDGYDTRLAPDGAGLSGGQIQRIALARALFGAPPLLILDEPDSALDAEGANALGQLLRRHRAAGGAAIIATHRLSLIRDCDLIVALDGGAIRATGPRDAMLGGLSPPARPTPLAAVGGRRASA